MNSRSATFFIHLLNDRQRLFRNNVDYVEIIEQLSVAGLLHFLFSLLHFLFIFDLVAFLCCLESFLVLAFLVIFDHAIDQEDCVGKYK